MAAKTNLAPSLKSAFSRAIFMGFRNAVGVSPRALDVLMIYEELRQMFFAENPEEPKFTPVPAIAPANGEDTELANRFRMSYSMLSRNIERNDLFDIADQQFKILLPLIRRLDNPNVPFVVWRQIATNYAELLRAILADKKIFTTLSFLSMRRLRWPQLRLASAKQEAVEKLKYDDPELYTRTLQNREQLKQITAEIQFTIKNDGLKPSRATILGRVVSIGTDRVTKERIVYDIDGSRTPIDDYYAKLKNANKQYQAQARINPKSLRDLDSMRSLPASFMDTLDQIPPDQIRYVSLTDDPDKDSALTRLYPVVKIDGTEYVQSGRFKGFAVPDLVNVAGRQIEGSSYYYDMDSQRITRRENPKGKIENVILTEQEPYITLVKHKGKQKLLIRLQNTRGRDPKDPVALREKEIKGAARKAVDKLSQIQPTIIKVKNDFGNLFMFDAKDFTAIKKRVGGVAMSSAAARFLKAYFDDLLRAQQAAESEDISRFDELGMRRPLWHFQKKALAWLEATGDRGICALDTGLGKTTVAIGTIRSLQIRISQGERMSGNGRFLFVCEKALLGNFAREVAASLTDEETEIVLNDTDVVTYQDFLKNRKENPTYGDDYTAIFFDEAHLHLIKRSSAKYKAATAVKCERKIILSASPIVNTPRDMLTMASVTNGVDLNTKEGRTEERLFIKRFAKKVGNRIVGVTDDPDLEEDMRSWVKRNLYYGDKRDTRDETGLPELTVTPPAALTMDPQVEVMYRQTMDQLLKELKTVANKGVRGNQPVAVEASRVKLAKLIALLTKLSDVPEEIVPGASNPKLERSNAILRDRLSSKTIFFGDSIPLVRRAFQNFVDAYPMRAHALALSDQIIFRNAMGKETVYRQKAYTDPDTGLKATPKEWATIILKQLQQDRTLLTLTLTGKYAVGQNLQAFSAVVHLDRDSWSSETMKQRTARAWRSGQRQPVTEFTMDTVYSNPRASAKDDMTLDQIRRYMQEMDSELFDSIIRDSKTFVLGETWTDIDRQRSGAFALKRRMLERALSPYATQLGKSEP